MFFQPQRHHAKQPRRGGYKDFPALPARINLDASVEMRNKPREGCDRNRPLQFNDQRERGSSEAGLGNAAAGKRCKSTRKRPDEFAVALKFTSPEQRELGRKRNRERLMIEGIDRLEE